MDSSIHQKETFLPFQRFAGINATDDTSSNWFTTSLKAIGGFFVTIGSGTWTGIKGVGTGGYYAGYGIGMGAYYTGYGLWKGIEYTGKGVYQGVKYTGIGLAYPFKKLLGLGGEASSTPFGAYFTLI